MNLHDIKVRFIKNTNIKYADRYGTVSIIHKYFKINFLPIFIREDGKLYISEGSFVSAGRKPTTYSVIYGELKEVVQYKLDVLLNKKHEWALRKNDIKLKKERKVIEDEQNSKDQDGWITIPD